MKIKLNWFMQNVGPIACMQGLDSTERILTRISKKNCQIETNLSPSFVSDWMKFIINETRNEYENYGTENG